MTPQEFMDLMEVQINLANEKAKAKAIYAQGVEAKIEAVGVQPCGVQDCSTRARYFSSRNQYCESHMAIKGNDIFKKVSA